MSKAGDNTTLVDEKWEKCIPMGGQDSAVNGNNSLLNDLRRVKDELQSSCLYVI